MCLHSAFNSASHVLTALKSDLQQQVIRFSFSKYNSLKEVVFIEKLSKILNEKHSDTYKQLAVA